MIPQPKFAKAISNSLASQAYARLKADIFDFHFLPGDRFSENEISERLQMSRTPIREALFRLQREGYVEVLHKSGWQVRPFDFQMFEQLYDVRSVLEAAAVELLCAMPEVPLLQELGAIWFVPEDERITDAPTLSVHDERFHEQLVEASGNAEMARIHHDITERIRVIRRLEFTEEMRIDVSYEEHAKILRAIIERRTSHAKDLLRAHIALSQSEVKKITIQMLHQARARSAARAAA
ncbi:GntR family transcriptional regulator [Noviherbaspirillum cavernae]|uniref:GntR family transcriptional regulator n=1 Tax=Noviherbaspirillum cavernae TaxID=2320862 RepID=A0A418WWI0_9BURK|nr:GntR family transcriptional regulator [Noviherbaspirillum cavernae]RJF97055.1 GntR family transcriptional regulator [Noviherbaspirillum cavernae]